VLLLGIGGHQNDVDRAVLARQQPRFPAIPDIGVSSTLVINTLTSPSDLMKSSASLASTNVATVWRSFSRSFDTAFKTVDDNDTHVSFDHGETEP
jgi:hypothetical protein